MPPVRPLLLRVTLNLPRTENNAATATSDLQWQPVIGIVAGFLSILLAVYLLHSLFQFHTSGVPHRVLRYILPSGTRRVSHSVTESETSGSWADLSSSASPAPPPYTARSIAIPLYTVTVPPRSLQGGLPNNASLSDDPRTPSDVMIDAEFNTKDWQRVSIGYCLSIQTAAYVLVKPPCLRMHLRTSTYMDESSRAPFKSAIYLLTCAKGTETFGWSRIITIAIGE
ncbi:uncharacterized protein BJ212DRAFT_1525903 [Suillus subaureus]|uniref:Uncharacterized protein n=1 Tax=Suillus subaureus TaxID=48587 RepID=A0A9P7E516_9AGAM|nr:uncharacterized protein BJ212DRAFT_1525903 [Suillus subaureus]KAG1810887.1 hypothetical protein BJ212DRAFT_1525903 [Suillus subaureus]